MMRTCSLVVSHPALILAFMMALCSAPGWAQETSFEDLKPGKIQKAKTEAGSFTVTEGEAAIVNSHARSGSQALHLLGGESTTVEWKLSGKKKEIAELVFWAERWTRRAPFTFQVEVRQGKSWKQVFDGSSSIPVGSGLQHQVRIPIGAKVDQVRFLCVAPPSTGILIDDLQWVLPGPAVLAGVRQVEPVLPVLVDVPWNPVARIDFEVTGTEGSFHLAQVEVELAAMTHLESVEEVALFWGEAELDYRDPVSALGKEQRFSAPQKARSKALRFRGDQSLTPGNHHLWIAVSVSEKVDLDGRIGVLCSEVKIDGKAHEVEAEQPSGQRFGVALRNHGDDDVAVFRIPGLVTTPKGTLIAVYDLRWRGWGDLPGEIDVGMSRSTDGGYTWEAQKVIMDMGGGSQSKWRGDGVGDPAILVDRETGTIYVMAVWSHGDRGWNGSGPGLSPEQTGQLMLVSSEDDGKTWSRPRNLTAELKDPAWCFLLQGPGRGISMSDGTLVFPAQYQASVEEGRIPSATVIYSRDHGKTWAIGTSAKTNTTEAAVVELEDGELMLNMRDNRGGSRAIAVSTDFGSAWSPHPTTRRSLVEPVCMASLLHVGREVTGKADGRLIFSNPNVAKAPRRRMALQGSLDFGKRWTQPVLVLDEGPFAGYSCLTMIDADTIGILYEGSRAHMTFQRIPLTDLFPQ